MISYRIHQIIYPLGIPLYPWFIFQYLIAWPFGFYYVFKEAMRRKDIDANEMLQMFVWIFLGAVAFARVFAYFGPWKSGHIGATFSETFLNMFSTNYGGWVAYGGIFGAILFGWIFTKTKKIDSWKYADVTAPAIMLGFCIARLGCFFTGCCSGSITNVPWAIIREGIAIHPTQLYNSLMDLGVFMVLLHLNEKREKEGMFYGYVFLSFLLLYPILRFFTEFFRGDYSPANFFFGLTSSQLLSLVIFIIALPLMLCKLSSEKRKPKKTGFSIRKMTYILILAGGISANIGAYIFDLWWAAGLVLIITGLIILFAGVNSIFSKPKN